MKSVYTKTLGEGGFGKLQLHKCKRFCENYNCNKCVVIKTMKKDLVNFEKNKQYFINHFNNEFYMTINLNHPNIRKTLSIDKKNHRIVFEYCPGIDLLDYLEQYKGNVKFLLHLYSQILDGVEYLHNNNIAHLDLKLENIMVYNNHIKIIDFGEAMLYKINGTEISYRGIHGTDSYMPPEMIKHLPYKPYRADIWSCGILLFNIIHPYAPWECASITDKLFYRFKYTLENFNILDKSIFNLDKTIFSKNEQKIIMTIFKYTLQINPKLRKSITYLKSIFNLIDWETSNTNSVSQTKNILHKKFKYITN